MNAANALPGHAARSGAPANGLTVGHLDVGYRLAPVGTPLPAIRDVNFQVQPGESLAIVGESGCGKSTIALAISRLLAPSAVVRGDVALDGVDVLALDGADLRRWWASSVAMVFQDPVTALNPTTRVGEQVAEVLRVRGVGRHDALEQAVELLRRVHLPDPAATARRYPHQLSGGQQQRVVIAMALAVRPRLLVLDEPTTGLDATVEAAVLELIAELRADLDASVVFITHDLSLVPTVSDRVAVVYAGEIVEHGDVTSVLAAPEHPYTRGLLASLPQPGHTKYGPTLARIAGSPPPLGERASGCGFAERCAHALTTCTTAPISLRQRPDGRDVRCDRVGDASIGTGPTTTTTERPASPAVPDAEPEAPAPLLAVRDLHKRYGNVDALRGVSLHVNRGEIVGVVGESGSGKSTLARTIAGLTAADGGAILLDGRELHPDVRRRSTPARRSVQMVFQHPEATLNPRQRVRQILERAIRKLDGRRPVGELAAECQIDATLLDRRSTSLSGGQRQRVAIARAIAGEPDLVLCDEPVSALDVSVQSGILSLFVDLQRRHDTAYLFISHDLAVVEYIADRIVVMFAGRIVEEGPAGAVLAPPHHPYTRALLTARQRATADGPAPVAGDAAGSDGCPFFERCPRRITGVCDRIDPPLREVATEHRIACHLDVTALVDRGAGSDAVERTTAQVVDDDRAVSGRATR